MSASVVRAGRMALWGAAVCSTLGGSRLGIMEKLPLPGREATPLAPAAVASKPAAASKTPVVKRPAPARKPAPRPSASVGYVKVIARGVPLHVVKADTRRPEVRVGVATANHGIGSREPWARLIGRVRPAAAVTGTYYCTTSFVPVGRIVMNGRVIAPGSVGTGLGYRAGARPEFISRGRRASKSGQPFDSVLWAGPRLLAGGQYAIRPTAEGFRDPAIWARKKRTAVAVDRNGKLMLVATSRPVYLWRLAAALKEAGAVDAMCLDGGSSAGLYHRGKTWVKPLRSMTNLLVVYDSPARYEKYAGLLNPHGPRLTRGPWDGS